MEKSNLIYAGQYLVDFDMNDSAADSGNQKPQLVVSSRPVKHNTQVTQIKVWTTSQTVQKQLETHAVFEWSPEGDFNHRLLDRLWQLLSIPGKSAITLMDEWGKNGRKEKTVCSAWKWKREWKKTVWVVGWYKVLALTDQKWLHWLCFNRPKGSLPHCRKGQKRGPKCWFCPFLDKQEAYSLKKELHNQVSL